jgi:hypothetical protein
VMVPFAYTVCFFVKNPVSMVNLFQKHFITGKKQLKISMNIFCRSDIILVIHP